jgi:hypothetical protein
MPCSERVIVEHVVTSCSCRPARSGLGTRLQQTSSALPISNAATRAMICSSSWLSWNIFNSSPLDRPSGKPVARRSRKDRSESNSRARSNTEGPTGAAPSAQLAHGLARTKEQRRRRATGTPIFSPERATPTGVTDD